MSDYRVARRYAKSIFELANEKQTLEEVHASMVLIFNTCSQNRDLVLLLRNPVIRYDYKLRVLKRIFENNIDGLSGLFLELLTRKNRSSILPSVAEVFSELYNEYKQITIARVTTAVPLSAGLRKAFIDSIKKENEEVILSEKVDESLIGGYILNIGDKQIDDSILRKLKSLEKELTKDI